MLSQTVFFYQAFKSCILLLYSLTFFNVEFYKKKKWLTFWPALRGHLQNYSYLLMPCWLCSPAFDWNKYCVTWNFKIQGSRFNVLKLYFWWKQNHIWINSIWIHQMPDKIILQKGWTETTGSHSVELKQMGFLAQKRDKGPLHQSAKCGILLWQPAGN